MNGVSDEELNDALAEIELDEEREAWKQQRENRRLLIAHALSPDGVKGRKEREERGELLKSLFAPPKKPTTAKDEATAADARARAASIAGEEAVNEANSAAWYADADTWYERGGDAFFDVPLTPDERIQLVAVLRFGSGGNQHVRNPADPDHWIDGSRATPRTLKTIDAYIAIATEWMQLLRRTEWNDSIPPATRSQWNINNARRALTKSMKERGIRGRKFSGSTVDRALLYCGVNFMGRKPNKG